VRYVEHVTALNRPDTDGVRLRDIYAEKARQGSRTHRDLLEGPPYPWELAYLDQWSMMLVGRSGATQFGIAPLSFTTIRDWADLTGNQPTPQEIEALLVLDAVRIASPIEPKKEEQVEDAGYGGTPVAKVAAWPTKKQEHAHG
jgi:hypothetical protein